MADRLAHRGPDDYGDWLDPDAGIAMGHRRLSIVDLSPTGHQPMVSACGRYCIVFNGEIYNWRSLARPLESENVVFRGTSDTEVLLEAVARWGLETTLSRCAGMFAFALWDRGERRLHLARDRLGEKPLYVMQGEGWMAFASELKAFFAIPSWGREIDRQAVAEFVRYGYVGAPRCIYKKIFKMLPGTVLSISNDGVVSGRTSPDNLRPYWSLPPRVLASREDAPDEIVLDRFESLLKSVIADQAVADVPVGAFLSGGVDSSTVVALLQSLSSTPVRTFTVKFPVASHDESLWAGRVAEALGTNHTVLNLDSADLIRAAPDMGRVFDEPFADPSQVPTYLISREARHHVKVCLTGDGGDEVFGGYNRYTHFRRSERAIGAVPSTMRPLVARLLRAIPVTWLDALSRGARSRAGEHRPLQSAGGRVHKLATMFSLPDSASRYESLLRTSVPEGLVLGDRRTACDGEADFGDGDEIEDLLMRHDLLTYLPDDNLVKVDRASMAHSLECRAPLLDHRVVEAALALPVSQRFRDGRGKWTLRGLFGRHLPPELLDRPKAGFSVPVSQWLRDDLNDWIRETLSFETIESQGFFDGGQVSRVLTEHLDGRRDHGRLLWALAIFQTWLSGG